VSAGGQPRLRLRLKPAAETAVRSGHPWVFAESVRDQNRAGHTGELAIIYDRNDRFLAAGLYDADSPLRVRVVHLGKPAELNDAWWHERFRQALARRDGILDERTTACRLLNGESDGWPGLVVDRFAEVLVMKLYTAAWLPRLNLLREWLRSEPGVRSVVLRLSRNVQATFGAAGFRDGMVLEGAAVNGPVVFQETGLHFEADVVAGQKTGFFLDQRENRRAVESLARGADVLNAFSFSGGFSLYAARGGAKAVASLDISAHALASARKNFHLNERDDAVARCRHETIQADAFAWLEQNTARQFDVVILDPPSLAKREAERAGAIRAYEKLVSNGLRAVRKGGTLVSASCSGHVSTEEFFGAVRRAVQRAGRTFAIIREAQHAPDHPATFAEAQYLKALFLKLD
jgi:23S rRNA (cytosine1962-C5)-methyltransferase